MDNTVKASNGTEVYTNKILELSDEYINCELDNKEDIFDISVFTGMILYISDNIEKPDNGDIEQLDNIFNIFIRLCCKYKISPTLELFAMLVNINPNTFSAWSNGEYRNQPGSTHSLTVKKWKNTCKNMLVNSLTNSRGTDANKIFIAKAAYGMVETAPIPVENKAQVQSIEEIQARYRAHELSENGKQLELPKGDF